MMVLILMKIVTQKREMIRNIFHHQLIAKADFRTDFGTYITNILEAECDDVENVKDLQEEAHSENEDNLERKKVFTMISKKKEGIYLSGY